MKLPTKHILIGSLIILAVILIFLNLITQPPSKPSTTPTPTPPQTISSNQSRQILKVTLNPNLTPPQIPTKIPIYQAELIDGFTYASQIASQLNLPPHPQSNSLWLGTGGSLNYLKEKNLITITHNHPPPKSAGIDPNQAALAAQTYLNNLNLGTLELDPRNTILLEGQLDYINANPKNNPPAEQAVKAVIPFRYYIGSLPFYYGDISFGTLNVTVNSDSQITKINLTPPLNRFEEITQAPSISLIEAVSRINSPQSSLIGLKTNSPINKQAFQELVVNQINLEYRLTPETSQILPYYNFTGRAISQEDPIDASVVILAI